MRRKTILAFKGLAALTLVFGLGRISFTQSARPQRIVGPIAGSPAVWLQGNRRPMFQPENDLGPAPDSLKLENISLVFKPTEEQQANLTALLAQQEDQSSPLYHHWLTPEQFADQFGLSPTDVAQVAAWLQSQGFTITQKARSRLWVNFTGTAAQVQSAFHTEIHNYSLEGKSYYANASEPAVPAALADVVLGITSLDNYAPKPRGVFRRVKAGPRPNFTSSLSGDNFVAPGDFAAIYDVQNLYNEGIDGTGQSIAVMGQTDIAMSDITAFRSAAGLPANNPTVVVSGTDPGTSSDSGVIAEAALDIEWSGAVAPKAQIIYVNSANAILGSLFYAVDQNVAPVLSLSYGNCEKGWGTAYLNSLSQLAQMANSKGQTILAAAGDSGAADCDYSTSATSPVTLATKGLAVDAPASLPYVTGMGGSEFSEGEGVYWKPATATTGDILNSALSYIPEMAWNDTSSTNGLLAGGGGASTFTPPGDPSKPVWQTGFGVPNDNARDVPDLALNASPAHEGYLICVQGSCVNGFRLPASDSTDPNGLTVAGGTSAATPTFAGIVALINQKMNTPKGQGNINPILYSMAVSSPAAFHDITAGSNKVPCEAGTVDCPSGGDIGFDAGPGYDQATGLGSVDAFNLVNAWNSKATENLPAPALSAPANGLTGVPLTPAFSWTAVTGAAGYRIMVATSPATLPTNPAVVTCGSCIILEKTSGNGTTSYTPASGVLAANTLYYWQVQALEPSSSSGTAAWSTAFVFNTGVPDFSLGVSPSSLTIAPGGSGTSTLTLTPTNNFSGSPTFTCSVPGTLGGVTCTVGTLKGNNTATITLTASSTAMFVPAFWRNPRFGGGRLVPLVMLGLLLIVLSPRRGVPARSWNLRQSALLGAVLAALLIASLSCGSGGGGGGSVTPPTPTPESGTVTVTGVSNSLSHSAQITLSVSG